jgi:Phosphoglycerate dehydrogenase and related dehydrogenases
MSLNILIILPVDEHQKILFKQKAPDAEFTFTTYKELTREQVQKANIIFGNAPASMIENTKNLQWIQLQSAGATDYVNGVLPDSVILTNASGAYGLAISEYMLAVLLEIYKKLHLYRDNQKCGTWAKRGRIKSISNSTALIIGAGDIGGEFAKKLKSLGAYTIGVRNSNGNKPDYFDKIHFMDELDELLPRADIVSLSLPDTKLTRKIINDRTLKLMKNDAVLINVGRGTAIDTEALCDTLQTGRLLGVALDVTDPEPLPNDHRLWRMENVVITPHCSGGNSLQDIIDNIMQISLSNLGAFLKGEKLNNIVDIAKGY